MYAKPNPKRVAFDQRVAAIPTEIETCYRQHKPAQIKHEVPMRSRVIEYDLGIEIDYPGLPNCLIGEMS